MREILITFLLIACVAISYNALANSKEAIYVWHNKDGVLVFSDTPKKGAEKVKLTSNVMSMPSTDTSVLDTPAPAKPLKFSVQIITPKDQGTIRDNSGSVHITGEIKPRFIQGHQVQLFLDGVAVSKPQSSALFVLRNVDRGAHTLTLKLLNAEKKVLSTSAPTTFYLHRKGIN